MISVDVKRIIVVSLTVDLGQSCKDHAFKVEDGYFERKLLGH